MESVEFDVNTVSGITSLVPGSAATTIVDNNENAYQIREASMNFLRIDTENEKLVLGDGNAVGIDFRSSTFDMSDATSGGKQLKLPSSQAAALNMFWGSSVSKNSS